MAKKASVTSEKTSIRRIKASDDAPKKEIVKKKTADKKVVKNVATKKTKAKSAVAKRDINAETKNPFKAFGNYLPLYASTQPANDTKRSNKIRNLFLVWIKVTTLSLFGHCIINFALVPFDAYS